MEISSIVRSVVVCSLRSQSPVACLPWDFLLCVENQCPCKSGTECSWLMTSVSLICTRTPQTSK
eukprot:6466283-Amphidinium_carterae.2